MLPLHLLMPPVRSYEIGTSARFKIPYDNMLAACSPCVLHSAAPAFTSQPPMQQLQQQQQPILPTRLCQLRKLS
jgi:hypothetical protein